MGKPNPPAPFPKREGGDIVQGLAIDDVDRQPLDPKGTPFPHGEGARGVRFLILLTLLLAACAPRAFERPNGVVYASDRSLYVMDFGNYRIVQVSRQGKLLKVLGRFGSQADQIHYGWDLATDSQGNLYFGNVVRDNEGTSHDGVKVFNRRGRFLREIGQQDYSTVSGATPNLPYGVEVDDQDRVYIADYGTNAIRILTSQGDLLATLPGKGNETYSFVNPGDTAVDDARGRLYVSDFTLGNILQFAIDWSEPNRPRITFEKVVGGYGRAPGQFAFPQNLAVDDESGVLYVGDMANRRIQAINAEGEYLASYAPPDVEDWQVLGLSLGPEGYLAAADALNHAVWLFSTEDGAVTRVEMRR